MGGFDLDFTALDNLAPKKDENGFTETLEENGSFTKETQKSQPESKITATAGNGSISQLEREKQGREQHKEMFKSYQQSIQRAGMLRSEITKGIQAGEEPLFILLKALECISLMTCDTLFYKQNEETILAVYGYGMKEPAPLEADLVKVNRRLDKLTATDLEEIPPDAQKLIERAIRFNEKRAENLERELNRAKENT